MSLSSLQSRRWHLLSTRLKIVGVRLGLMTSAFFLTLVLLEGVVRLFGPQQLIVIRPDIWIPEEGVGWRVASNLDTAVNTGERAVRLLTDAYGYRVGRHRLTDGEYRILALGDSFLEALQLDYEQTMTALLEERLSVQLRGPVVIVNTGTAGWGPNQYALKARAELERSVYDLVIVFLYVGNDVERRRIDHFPPRKSAKRRLRWPRNLHAKEWIDAVAFPVNDFLETRSHLFILFKNRAWFFLMRLGLSKRGLHDVYLRSEAASPRWTATGQICADLAQEAANRGIKTIFVLLPGVYQVDEQVGLQYARAVGADLSLVDFEQPNRLLSRELAAHGLSVVDTTPALREAHAAGETDLYGKVDTHFGPGGHRVVASMLEPVLVTLLRK